MYSITSVTDIVHSMNRMILLEAQRIKITMEKAVAIATNR